MNFIDDDWGAKKEWRVIFTLLLLSVVSVALAETSLIFKVVVKFLNNQEVKPRMHTRARLSAIVPA